MGFTDFDRDLVFDAVTYKAASGFTATAIEGQLGLAVSNLDVQGALLSDALYPRPILTADAMKVWRSRSLHLSRSKHLG
ncbi:DUF2163 domain-containing protein [Hyphomicrobium sp.]|uniref:baseplate hub domain-containing protein n=1 Tax=Hyphomicrobium sp. TaxID=82 RepID=UPI0025BA0BB3|nr:DUF2163 domain-containing protein [Hyphomicrobium sp.]